jgi:hypothetical protein
MYSARPVPSSYALHPGFSEPEYSPGVKSLLMAAQLRPASMTGRARAPKRRSVQAGQPLLERALQGWRLVSRSR